MTTDTPRTDALIQACYGKRDAAIRWDMESLARTLERDNATLRAALTGALVRLDLDTPMDASLAREDIRAALVQS